MEQIIITHPDGSQLPLISKGNISIVTKAEQTISLLADDVVNISVNSATPLPFVLGDTIEVYGKTYTLNQLPTVKKTGDRRFNYELLDAQFLLPDSTVGDSFTGTLFAFVQILVSNANRVFPGKWSVGEYPDETEYKTLSFTGENCLSVLQRICEEWEQEFEIMQSNGTRVLNIRNAGENFPYTFKYGRTGGLYELSRQNINSKNVVTRLYVYGGSNNVPNNYLTNRNSSKLCLPDKNFIKQFAGNLTVVNLFAVGDYIPVQDADIGVDKSIRITGFTRDLLKPYRYSITLGDSVTKSAYVRQIAAQRTIDKIIEMNNLFDPSKARRNWRASQEVLSMVFDTEGDYYSEKIKTASIETTMLQAGAKSMQFVLQNVIFEPNYQSNPNCLRVTDGTLIHYVIEKTIRNWTIAATEFSDLVSNTAYYIYARCQTAGNAGSIILGTEQRKVDYEHNYYNFMVGVLNSVPTNYEDRPARIVSLTYGSTTIKRAIYQNRANRK